MMRLLSRSGLEFEISSNGSIRRMICRGTMLNLFPGNELEGGPVNLYLRLHDGCARAALNDASEAVPAWTALLGPNSPTRFSLDTSGPRLSGEGVWRGIHYRLMLHLAAEVSCWFWHLSLMGIGTRTDAAALTAHAGEQARHRSSQGHAESAPEQAQARHGSDVGRPAINLLHAEAHAGIDEASPGVMELDLVYAQDLGLTSYATARLNEYYVSQYIDHTPLEHPRHGAWVASRQNLAVEGRHPWCAIGSLGRAASYATDALQLYGIRARAGMSPEGVVRGLPGTRLQHEHALVAIQEERLRLHPGQRVSCGFFGCYLADHPAASSPADLAEVERTLSLPEARPSDDCRADETTQLVMSAPAPAAGLADEGHAQDAKRQRTIAASACRSLFVTAPALAVLDLHDAELDFLFGAQRRHEERDEQGRTLSFFVADRHVVLLGKELRVLRPHGHILRTGAALEPDECALTSTVWMNGVFHSLLTQGHVSFNRFLSTQRSYLGLFRAHGLRAFVQIGERWQLLEMPAAFELSARACRWYYRHEGGLLIVSSSAHDDLHELELHLEVRCGDPLRFLICCHVALGGDDGAEPGHVQWRAEGACVRIVPPEGSELAQRFPQGAFELEFSSEALERCGGDELLFEDGATHRQPYLCLQTRPAAQVRLKLRGALVVDGPDRPTGPAPRSILSPGWRMEAPDSGVHGRALERLQDFLPWLEHDALVHYLSPRGLEQYSGGGWGTRDVTQGPAELLLALGHHAMLRKLLLGVMRAQNPDGDWPQWFAFFERDRHVRANDSHGDIVFWPVLALAQYLLATADASVLEESVPFFDARGPEAGEHASVWQHVQRALSLIDHRRIPNTALAAYGHGDWNDALQPVDPRMRERLCSAWTVTLHHQMLTTLSRALELIGRATEAARLREQAGAVRRDFQRLLIAQDVLAGFGLFEDSGLRLLLHPSDEMTGIRYSALAMVHAILEGMLTPEQARRHLGLIETHLWGPDGLRLFDRPMDYRGGPQRLFQRAESAAYFGREIGLMYMHAHLRHAQALAHLGEAQRFFRALCLANPVGIRELVPSASLRQANCYYSSSDAAFTDRYQASAEYRRIADGTVALEGGWRVYSSGAGIASSLVVRRLLGLDFEAGVLSLDPVVPSELDGLRLYASLYGHEVEILYRVGPRGCGVQCVRLENEPLPIDYAEHPYRRGAARIAAHELLRRFASSGRNRLSVFLD